MDILFMYTPDVIENILAGVVWELQITQAFVVIALGLMAVPIMMVVLSTVLPPRANRIANLVAASLYVPVSVFNIVGELWTYYFALGIGLEVIILATIMRLAWVWPRITNPSPEWSHNAAAVNP